MIEQRRGGGWGLPHVVTPTRRVGDLHTPTIVLDLMNMKIEKSPIWSEGDISTHLSKNTKWRDRLMEYNI